MALKIRMTRIGAKNRPFYRIVVADGRAPRDGRFIARLGTYNPMLPKDNKERVVLDLEAAKQWIAKGAQPSDRVLRFLDAAGVLKRKPRNNPQKAIPRKDRKPAEGEAAAAPAGGKQDGGEKQKQENPAKEEAKAEVPAEAKAEAPAEPAAS